MKIEISLIYGISNAFSLISCSLYLEPLRPILFTLGKFRQIFLKIKRRRGPPVWDTPRHKLEVITLLIIAIGSVKTVI